MRWMHRWRKPVPSSRFLPEHRALRSIQAPQHVKDENGQWRLSSAAFSPSGSDQSCSVDLEHLLHSDGLHSTALYPGIDRSVGLIALPLHALAAEEITIAHDPVIDNWYHGAMRGAALKRKGATKRLAGAAEIVIPINEVLAADYHKAAKTPWIQT